MSAPPPDPRPRRAFLRTLALLPAATAAGCATARSGAATPAASAAGPVAPAAPPAPAPDDELRALRAFPLAPDAEPAFVFRALPARPRTGQWNGR
jgi:hypothetical protein